MALLAGGCGGREVRTLRVLHSVDVSTFDPHHHNEVVAWSLLANVYDALVGFSPAMALEPGLAESWERLDSLRTRFHLRRGVYFHSGAPFSAADVIASFERARNDPRSAITHQLAGITGFVSEGDFAVVVETGEPAPTLLNRLAFLFIVPRGDAGRTEITTPIGTGPYRWVGVRDDGSVELAAFPSWRGLPPIRQVVVGFETDENRRLERLADGDVDVSERLGEGGISDLVRYPALRAAQQPRLSVQLLEIIPAGVEGEARRALADARVRRAMLLAIDRGALVERVYRGQATVAAQYLHPVVFGYDPSLQAEPHDPAAARGLLAEAGFRGRLLKVTLGHGLAPPQLLTALEHDLAAIGITLEAKAMPFAELLRQARSGGLALVYVARACLGGDAADFFDTVLHTPDPARGLGLGNTTGFSNPEVDRLLDRARSELDTEARRRLLQQAQRLALRELPILPLAVRWGYLGVSSRVEVQTRFDERLSFATFRWR